MKTCYCADDKASAKVGCPECLEKLVASRDFQLDRFTRTLTMADHMARTVGLVATTVNKFHGALTARLIEEMKTKGKKPGNMDPYNLGRTLETVAEVMKRGGQTRALLVSLTLEDWRKLGRGADPVPPLPTANGQGTAPEGPAKRFTLLEGGEGGEDAPKA